MTGYTVHTGTTVKFSGGWDRIFSGKKAKKKTPGKPAKQLASASSKKGAKKTVKKAKRSK
jgi:hypothetical protein